MADINFGILDTQLPGRIAAIPQEAQKQQTANMLQAMQMQGAMNQNALSQYSLASAKRSDESLNAVNAALRGSIVDGKINHGLLISNLAGGAGASKIPDFLKAQSEGIKRELDIEKTRGEIGEQAKKAIDYQYIPFSKNAVRVNDIPSLTTHLTALYADPLLGKIAAKFKPFEQALADDSRQISTPDGLRQWQAENANLTGQQLTDLLLKVTTRVTNLGNQSKEVRENALGQQIGDAVAYPIGVSANTAAQIEASRKNHLENLAQQGWTFDTERGIGINARLGISRPISTLTMPFGSTPAALVGGAPAVSSATAAVPIIAPGGGVPGQRQSPAGQPAAGVLGPKPADLQKTEIELNKQYTSESKGFIETKIAIDKARAALRDAATNPTAGLSAGTAFMKILDPQSVVRETELAMALKSSGWFDRVTNISNTLRSGKTVLTPTQIINLSKTIDGLFEEVKAEQRIVDSGYARRAKSYGLDVSNIIIDRGQNKIGITEKTPLNAPPIQSFRRPG